jgi:hypothetical protein
MKMNKTPLMTVLAMIALMSISMTSCAQKNTIVRKQALTCSQTSPLNLNMTTLTPEEKFVIQPYLNRLNVYQSACDSQAFTNMMIFTNMPTGVSEIQEESLRITHLLKAMAKIGIKPIVVAEPSSYTLGKLSFVDFSNGAYNSSLISFFAQLKSQGVTDSMMGIWVPFPEPNIPVWNSQGSTPATVAKNFNVYMEALRTSFPTTKGSLLLNSKSYEPQDTNWERGVYSPLTGYAQGLNTQYLDSIGIQGFPWIGPKNTNDGYVKTADVFLQPQLTVDLAKALNTNKVWYNTGSMSAKYTYDKKSTVIIPNSDRIATLNSILVTSVKVRNQLGSNSKVMLHLFAEDKSKVEEATNWSFSTAADLNTLKSFLTQANRNGFELGFFDYSK